jgi:hypothetical protein
VTSLIESKFFKLLLILLNEGLPRCEGELFQRKGEDMGISINNGPGPKDQATSDRKRKLAELEQIVKDGLLTYQEVGNALDEIRSLRLHKPEYKNFSAYLKEKWGMCRSHAYRLMAAAKVANCLPVGDRPNSERKATKRTEKRSPKAKQPSKAKLDLPTVSGSINRPTLLQIVASTPDPEEPDLDEEFAKFTSLLSDWEIDFTPGDYLHLVQRIYEHTKEIITYSNYESDHEYTDGVVVNQPIAEPELVEVVA